MWVRGVGMNRTRVGTMFVTGPGAREGDVGLWCPGGRTARVGEQKSRMNALSRRESICLREG